MNGAKLSGSEHSRSLPVMLAFISALLWGLWWIPVRWLNAQGLDAAWASVAMNAGAATAVLVWLLIARVSIRLDARTMSGAVLAGVAVSSYSVALNLSDVVRVILLFYLAPAWSKIIEWAFLGQGWTWVSTLTISLSLAGAYFVLGGEVSMASLNTGDMLALISGLSWAIGAALIFAGKPTSSATLSFAAAFCAVTISVIFLLLAPDSLVARDSVSLGSFGLGTGAGALYVLPILVLTMWTAQRLTPAVLTFLLTAEILSGVLSGVIFLDEPFGWMQALGAILILSAAAGEVVPHLRRTSG